MVPFICSARSIASPCVGLTELARSEGPTHRVIPLSATLHKQLVPLHFDPLPASRRRGRRHMIVYLGSTVGTRNSVLGDFVRRLTAILAADVAGYSRLMGGPVPPARSRFPLSYSAFFGRFGSRP